MDIENLTNLSKNEILDLIKRISQFKNQNEIIHINQFENNIEFIVSIIDQENLFEQFNDKQQMNNYYQKQTNHLISHNEIIHLEQKIHLSNNIVRLLRGPIKILFNGTLHIFDFIAQRTHINHSIIQTVKNGYEKSMKHFLKSTFQEITSDWIFISSNPNQGFNSPSIWMYNPQGQRILIKFQTHPLCAANEWLAYVLGKQLNLPVNEVQISIYENQLVTLHTDVAQDNEKTITFMELRKRIRDNLLTDPILGFMNLFDFIIQNVDRNQRNILITMPKQMKTIDNNNDRKKIRIHLIDHASCFGMGKLNLISLIACKFHTNHLSIVKFNSIDQARKFEQYLNRLSINDRKIYEEILKDFSNISNEQFDNWINEIRDLLTISQYNRIRDVLIRQRDIAKSYLIQWNNSSSIVNYF